MAKGAKAADGKRGVKATITYYVGGSGVRHRTATVTAPTRYQGDKMAAIQAAAEYAANHRILVVGVKDHDNKAWHDVKYDGTSAAWLAARKNRAGTIRNTFAELKAPNWLDISRTIWERFGYPEYDVYIQSVCRNAGLTLTRAYHCGHTCPAKGCGLPCIITTKHGGKESHYCAKSHRW